MSFQGHIEYSFRLLWPEIASSFNLLFISFLNLSVGFIQTFKQFLILQSLFGAGMGRIWGLVASTMLEDLPSQWLFTTGLRMWIYLHCFGQLIHHSASEAELESHVLDGFQFISYRFIPMLPSAVEAVHTTCKGG